MLYDVRLNLHYDYPYPVEGGRHHLRTMPLSLPGVQRVIAANIALSPKPSEQTAFSDFFGNAVTSIAFRKPHDTLDLTMKARVSVMRPEPPLDISPTLDGLKSEVDATLTLDSASPHHFLAGSPHAPIEPAITTYARESAAASRSVFELASDLCTRIHADFDYEPEATNVRTLSPEAFRLKAGVCQDFSHVMISGLRGLGVPARYVSGFIRTIPPPGKERLEGADAMHAWVSVWCGRETGWREFDPTNAILAGNDHIVIGYGRDYAGVAPIVGVLRTVGRHSSEQSVDVVPVAE
ncbi:MAG: transglutaminase family protein [Mesorhizobium sp.]|nr:transglutaminase family protein [Mesorhizobium sp.]MCO5160221.1 transglutaminase family protein [Mesorhizobium sp.]